MSGNARNAAELAIALELFSAHFRLARFRPARLAPLLPRLDGTAAGSMGADQKELLPADKQGLKCPCLCDRGLLV